MSYIDARKGSHTKPIIAVAGVHAVIAYALISGLAMDVVRYVDPPIQVTNIPDDTPPPPNADQSPPRRETQSQRTLVTIPTEPDQPSIKVTIVEIPPPRIDTPVFDAPSDVPIVQKQEVKSLAREARAAGNRAAWVTTDDYPPGAAREGAEGVTGIAVMIAADGRITACEATSTSGNAQLDDAACRFYARRGRFTPALDEQGHAIASRRVDRVRWQLPRD